MDLITPCHFVLSESNRSENKSTTFSEKKKSGSTCAIRSHHGYHSSAGPAMNSSGFYPGYSSESGRAFDPRTRGDPRYRGSMYMSPQPNGKGSENALLPFGYRRGGENNSYLQYKKCEFSGCYNQATGYANPTGSGSCQEIPNYKINPFNMPEASLSSAVNDSSAAPTYMDCLAPSTGPKSSSALLNGGISNSIKSTVTFVDPDLQKEDTSSNSVRRSRKKKNRSQR
ncbi:hypothetical protein Ciccas_004270 [Cichlidogyrus casuarinus]|uniref:Uncharacterized protein n=1 Tax=Cichlidogyrus casuarinus TaxID=1844966 RepID=A0ABD2QC32_9PLAT